MFVHNINPVFLELGKLKIYYYGLVYALGFIFLYIYLMKLSKKKSEKIKTSDIDGYIISFSLFGIIFARLIYYVFYNFNLFISDPFILFRFWNGGMSFHGGLIGFAVGIFLFSKRKKYSFYYLTDLLVLPLTLILVFGRIANFINGELYGRITSVPWAVKFKGVEGFRHPSQLYESFKNLLLFGIFVKLKGVKLKEGIRTWLFVLGYGILRFLIEFVRQPDVQVGNNGFIFGFITMGQILCLFMIIISSINLYFINKKSDE